MSRGAKTVIFILVVLVILSLALNVYSIWQLLIFREQAFTLQQRLQDLQYVALETISHTIQGLEAFDEATIEYTVQIDEQIPIEAVVPFQENMQFPVQVTIPINEEIDTTAVFQIPQFGLIIPVDITIPLMFDVPIDITVPVDIDRQVPISTTVPIQLEVPIVLDLGETPLPRYVELLEQGLKDLEQALSGAQE